MTVFDKTIEAALHPMEPAEVAVHRTGQGALPSVYKVTDLAMASIAAAGREVAALQGTKEITVDRRLASLWFDMTVRPYGWALPSIWDDLVGDYQAADGWIRLHTNAPHHRVAALKALGCAERRDAVSAAIKARSAVELETAVVTHGGCAAAMKTTADWAKHPQGHAVFQEPLIAWSSENLIAPTPLQTLAGVRVLDLTRILAGPVATRFLAGFGAEVLRIDPLDWTEPAAEPEVTLGKRCAGLDLRSTSGRTTFKGLLAQADVLVHGYRADALDHLGLDAGARRAINPNCIDVSLNAYGWSGPWTLRRGFDSLVQMSSGIAAAGQHAAHSDKPVPLPVQALDHATGYLMAAAVVRALRLRATLGQVMSARMSLARTAHLLVGAGVQKAQDNLAAETGADLSEIHEQTVWGPARRLRFPMTLAGNGPAWPSPASPLRSSAPLWSGRPR